MTEGPCLASQVLWKKGVRTCSISVPSLEPPGVAEKIPEALLARIAGRLPAHRLHCACSMSFLATLKGAVDLMFQTYLTSRRDPKC